MAMNGDNSSSNQPRSNGARANGSGRNSRVYTPAEFQNVLSKTVDEALGSKAISGVELTGVLGPYSDGKVYQNVIHQMKLEDFTEAASSITLVLPSRDFEQRAKMLENRPVRVRGDVENDSWNGRIRFRLYVRELADLDNESLETHPGYAERERSLMSVLGGYNRYGRRFPGKAMNSPPRRVCVIHPSSGQIVRDFLGPLKEIEGSLVKVESYPVSFYDTSALRDAISSTDAEIVALIRGGGESSEFRTLNDPELVKQWMNKDAYTVSGLGHASDSTLLDLVSDESCATPSNAGQHIVIAAKQSASSKRGSHQPSPPSQPGQPQKGETATVLAWAFFLIAVVVVILWLSGTPVPEAISLALLAVR